MKKVNFVVFVCLVLSLAVMLAKTVNADQTYTVKKHDTLSNIANDYGLKVSDLLAINPGITDPDVINPGQEVRIRVDIPDLTAKIQQQLSELASRVGENEKNLPAVLEQIKLLQNQLANLSALGPQQQKAFADLQSQIGLLQDRLTSEQVNNSRTVIIGAGLFLLVLLLGGVGFLLNRRSAKKLKREQLHQAEVLQKVAAEVEDVKLREDEKIIDAAKFEVALNGNPYLCRPIMDAEGKLLSPRPNTSWRNPVDWKRSTKGYLRKIAGDQVTIESLVQAGFLVPVINLEAKAA